MIGKELLQHLQGLSEEDLSKDIVLEEGDCDRVYDLDSVYEIEDDIVLSISQVYEQLLSTQTGLENSKEGARLALYAKIQKFSSIAQLIERLALA